MYELKKIGKVFTSKFVGTGPSSYKKKNLLGRSLTKVEKHCLRALFYVTFFFLALVVTKQSVHLCINRICLVIIILIMQLYIIF